MACTGQAASPQLMQCVDEPQPPSQQTLQSLHLPFQQIHPPSQQTLQSSQPPPPSQDSSASPFRRTQAPRDRLSEQAFEAQHEADMKRRRQQVLDRLLAKVRRNPVTLHPQQQLQQQLQQQEQAQPELKRQPREKAAEAATTTTSTTASTTTPFEPTFQPMARRSRLVRSLKASACTKVSLLL